MKQRIDRAFLIAVCLVALAARGMAQSPPGTKASHSRQPSGRIYSCGANSLFVLAKLMNRPATYMECVTLLPIRGSGNTMLEVRDAIHAIGLRPQAMKLRPFELQRVRVPCIAWMPRLFNRTLVGGDYSVGHYIVIRPVSQNRLQVLNYPEAPVTLDAVTWGKHLRSLGIDSVPVLLCIASRHANDTEMLASMPSVVDDTSSITDVTSITLRAEQENEGVLRWNFGEVPEGVLLKKQLMIVNATLRDIEISKILSGCRCTTLVPDTTHVLPGQRVAISATIDLSNRIGKQAIQGRIAFNAASIIRPVIIDIAGTVQPRWYLDVAHLDFGELDRDMKACERMIVIRPTEFAGDTALSVAKSTLNGIEGKLTRGLDSKGPYWLLAVNCDPHTLSGNIMGEIELYTAAGQQPALIIPVVAKVKQGVAVTPNRLIMTQERQSVSLNIRDSTGTPCKILGMQMEPSELANVINISSSQAHPVILRYASDGKRALSGLCSGILVVDVSLNEHKKRINIPLVVFMGSSKQSGISLDDDDAYFPQQ